MPVPWGPLPAPMHAAHPRVPSVCLSLVPVTALGGSVAIWSADLGFLAFLLAAREGRRPTRP